MIYKSKSNNTYIIFIFSLLFHIALIFFIGNIKFHSNLQQSSDDKIEIDLQTSEESQQQVSSVPLPTPNFSSDINNIKDVTTEKYSEITPPDINKISVNNQKVVKNNLLSIPSNIPLKINVSQNRSKGKKATGISKDQGKIKTRINGKNIKNILKNYLFSIRSKIEKNKKYPVIARKMGIEGITNVEFVIYRSGKLGTVKIFKSSGSQILDKAAVQAVKNAQPFSHIPEEINLNKIKIKLKIVFKIE